MPAQLAEGDPSLELTTPTTARGRPRGPQGPRIRTTLSNVILQTSESTSEREDNDIHSPFESTPPYSPFKTAFSGSSHSHGSDTRPPTPSPIPPTSPPPPDVPSANPVKVPGPKINPLTLPPKINFEPSPISHKGLSLEAAQWSFSSPELQQIVSRAIRLSSQESFIRLLSLENLDKNIPEELERLDNLRAVTQSKYRFHTHRRNMLLQGLNAIAMSASGKSHSADTAEVIGRLTAQLSENTADGDRLTEELLRISDQKSQLTIVQDTHWASALAVALRKLHTSYARRTKELVAAKGQISRLEGELDDAWREAERMAKEVDDTENVGSDYEDEVDIEIAEIVAVHRRACEPPVYTATAPIISDTATIQSSRSSSHRRRGSAQNSSRGVHTPRKVPARRLSFGTDKRMPSPAVPPPIEPPSPTQVHNAPGPSSPSCSSPTSLDIRLLLDRTDNNLEPEDTPEQSNDDTRECLMQSPLDTLLDPNQSSEFSEFDGSAIPTIWLQSDAPQQPLRIQSLMALDTLRVDAERTRPSSSTLSRVPSFDSSRAVSVSYSDSFGLGRIASRESAGASLPPLQPNRSCSPEFVRIPSDPMNFSSRSKTINISSSSSDRVLSPYTKLKMLTKRYTLPFNKGGVKRYNPPQPR